MLIRYIVRMTVQVVMDQEAVQKLRITLKPGTIRVRTKMNETLFVPFESMFTLDPVAVRADKMVLLEFLSAQWPQRAGGRWIRPLGDGLSLCDVNALLWAEDYAIALFQYGQLNEWWELAYDEQAVCPHSAKGACISYCTISIDKFMRPPRRKKVKKQPVSFFTKFRLSDLFPERGIRIA